MSFYVQVGSKDETFSLITALCIATDRGPGSPGGRNSFIHPDVDFLRSTADIVLQPGKRCLEPLEGRWVSKPFDGEIPSSPP